MTARSEARDAAVVVLLEAGWSVEKIREAFGLSDILAHQLVRAARPVSAGAGCCRLLDRGLFCDAPVRWAGSVYCDLHHVVSWGERGAVLS